MPNRYIWSVTTVGEKAIKTHCREVHDVVEGVQRTSGWSFILGFSGCIFHNFRFFGFVFIRKKIKFYTATAV